jgi:RNA polymerase-interacting CarD/CdnL/TRCF family regulator
MDSPDMRMSVPARLSERLSIRSKREIPTLNQITDLLQEHESKINAKLDSVREVYERYSKDMISLEQDLVDKKHK